ncbi:MAG: response regulator transcription factor [Polyangiales bacterium]|nr:response regulator transcription factor [Myxococcales bacterium]
MGIRVALLDDHAPTREAVSATLKRHAPGVSIVFECSDAESFQTECESHDIDVALIDLALPGMSGGELIRVLRTTHPNIACVALTVFEDQAAVIEAIEAGAHGYILKDVSGEQLAQAVEEAASGEHPISSRVAGFLLTRLQGGPRPETLSERELELALRLAEGKTYRECSEEMGIQLGTIQHYVKRLYRKLAVDSRQKVKAWVRHHKLD